ncbi:hypothetical protein N5P37_011389 [Trichoderma harzianum]|nr:hypothetical protein N5P37_011389 [Trichoderma harzianum]
MSQILKNVMLVGAGGNLGTHVLRSLLEAQFNVSVMSRASSKTTFPENVRVYKTDYSESSLISALEGYDAVVSTISGSGLKEQQKIIDAAILAGVKRFIPSEYGIDVCHPKAMEIVPFFSQKQQINAYLRSKESQGITWTSVATGPFLDWGLQAGLFGFDLKNRSATFVDEGTQPFSTTILPTVGKAIASVLTHASETENKRIFVHSFRTTQKQLLEILEKQTGTPWKVRHVPADEMISAGRQKMSNGQGGVFELLQVAMFKGGCGSDFETEFEVHNDLLELRPDNLEGSIASILSL